MKEIKFRAWDKKNKAMFYPQELIQLDRVYAGYFDDSGCPKTDENIILMQYTGLKDKNGREIYEYDLVRYSLRPSREGIGIVVWSKSEASWIVKSLSSETFYFLGGLDEIEVLGNVFENEQTRTKRYV